MLRRLRLPLLCCLLAAGAVSQAAEPAAAVAVPDANEQTSAAEPQTVTLLQGKLRFNLPAGFDGSDLPPGRAEDGTAGALGKLYVNGDTRQVVVISEAPTPGNVAATDNDNAFLTGAAKGFINQQKQASADYTLLGEEVFAAGPMGVKRINAKGSFAGTPTLNTSLLAGSGPRLAVIQIVSRDDDPEGHQQLVSTVLHSLPASSAPKSASR